MFLPPENIRCFQGVEIRYIGKKWVNINFLSRNTFIFNGRIEVVLSTKILCERNNFLLLLFLMLLQRINMLLLWYSTKVNVVNIFIHFQVKGMLSCRHEAPGFLLKRRLWHKCFPVNFAKILRTPFLQNTSGRPLLKF